MSIEFPFQKFVFNLSPVEPLILPSYKGSTLRGGFGTAFKRIVCAIKNKECSDCILKEKCVYSYIFETPPPADTKIMRKYTAAPHPFIIEPPIERKQGYTPQDNISFGLTLIGKSIGYLPYFIYAFNELGNMGIGKGRGKFVLTTVKIEDSQRIIYTGIDKTLIAFEHSVLNFQSGILDLGNASQLTLNFITPTRIKYDNKFVSDLQFHILIRNLLRRLSLLYYFHCSGDSSEWDFKGMIKKAEDIHVQDNKLKWHDWERYSARQDTRMKMGGFVGDITFEGDIGPFMNLIKAGEVLHVGKGTGFGLGKYEVTPSVPLNLRVR